MNNIYEPPSDTLKENTLIYVTSSGLHSYAVTTKCGLEHASASIKPTSKYQRINSVQSYDNIMGILLLKASRMNRMIRKLVGG